MHKTMTFLVLWAAIVGLVSFGAPGVRAAEPVVYAVLFHADGCSHCQAVINNVLPPLQLKYGSRLQIAMIEISSEENYAYFRQIEEVAQVSADRRGVPTLFIGDHILVGDQEIPKQLPGLIEQYLSAGGVDYPALPGLAERLPKVDVAPGACSPSTPCPGTPASGQLASLAASSTPVPTVAATPAESAAAAPASNGFTLANIVAVLLALSFAYALVASVMAGTGRTAPILPAGADILIPILCVIGLGVAGYLTIVETQNVKAVCGPIGDCNSVQSSPYAKLFGVLPVGVLGLLGYVGIIVAWVVGRLSKGTLAVYAPLLMLAMALFGVLFSLYLTYIELVVILAVCIWCLSSAVLMALTLTLSVGPAMRVLQGEEDEEVA